MMLIHPCLDPQDSYAEREVRVAFTWSASGPRLVAALDERDIDILPDLTEIQRGDLRREIAEAFRVPPEIRDRLAWNVIAAQQGR
jgi:hypothetical protein